MPTAMDLEIGKSAVAAKLLTQQQLDECLGLLHAVERKGGQKDLLTMLIQRGYLTPEQARQIPDVSEGMASRAIAAAAGKTPQPTASADETSAGAVAKPPSDAKPFSTLRPPKAGAKLSHFAFINLTGDGKSEVFHLPEKPISIGRDPVNDVVVDDQPVSGRHARLTFANNEMTLWDVGSKNGTFVNGERVTNRKLASGDVIGVGKARLIFVKGLKPDGGISGLLSPHGAEAGAHAVFVGKAGFKPNEKFFLGNTPLFIGREKTNNIVAADPTASAFHAQIAKSPEGVKIQDLNSRAGLLVNGQKVAVAVLEPDDTIAIGKFVLFCQEILGKRGTGQAKAAAGKADRGSEDMSTIISSLDMKEGAAKSSGLGAALLKELEEKAEVPAGPPAQHKAAPIGPRPQTPLPGRPHAALQLTCLSGPVKGQSFPLGKRPLTVGRSTTADIFLEDLSVSREHAMIRPVADRVEIVDLGSRNGIEVNGKRLKSHNLSAGDKVSIGKCLFIVEVAQA